MSLFQILIVTSILMALAAFALPVFLKRRFSRTPAPGMKLIRLLVIPFAFLRMQFGTPLVAAANTYDAAVETHEKTVPRTNDAAVTARHLLWKKGAADTSVDVCGAADIPLGTIDNTESTTGVRQTILLLGKGGTKKMVANGTIAAGVPVFAAASGKVSAVGVVLVGISLSATSGDDQILEVRDCPAVSLTPAEILTAVSTLSAGQSGKTFFLNSATEFATTLPAPALGLSFKFVCSAAPTGASYTIITGSSANIVKGSFASAADAGGSMDSETSGGDTITFVDGQAVAGDWIELTSDGTNWFVTGISADEDALTITTAS